MVGLRLLRNLVPPYDPYDPYSPFLPGLLSALA